MAGIESLVNEQYQVPLGITSSAFTTTNTYLVFTAYSVVSTVLQGGQCFVTTGTPNAVEPPVSISIPSGANTLFQSTAVSMFISSLGNPTCSAGGLATIVPAPTPIPTNTQQVAKTVSVTVTAIATITSAISPSNAPQSNGSSQPPVVPATGLSTGDRAAIGVAVPVGTIALLTMGLYLWVSRHRRSRRDVNQPNYQELEPRERLELGVDEVKHEVDADGNVAEHGPFVAQRRQDLRGPEHCRELESST